ncbi:MAG TPA: hypothetical protein VHO70_23135 [Chitinispirillaceae bacterium]|nr:hypothetical protein [Chitinispirillaceae bacterium]
MLPISQLFIAALILSIAVVIFTVIEWFHLGALSSAIARIESLIEKKSQEFDLFRRERATPPPQHQHTIIPQQPVSIEPTMSSEEPSGEIQIIRNIGGRFRDTSQINVHDHTVTSFEQKNSTPQSQNITLYLYSDVSKDADFNTLWNTLSRYLNSDIIVDVTIDLTGIGFIYENEIRYLDEIVKLVESKQGSVVFTNCSSDVTALMQSHPQLISKVKYI